MENNKQGWEERLKRGLLNQSYDLSVNGMTVYYRIGITSTYDWMKDFIAAELARAEDTGWNKHERYYNRRIKEEASKALASYRAELRAKIEKYMKIDCYLHNDEEDSKCRCPAHKAYFYFLSLLNQEDKPNPPRE